MAHPLTGEACGVHRTFLNDAAHKIGRKMLGRQGVIRVSGDAEVTTGLGISEGVEDALAVILSGWRPVWAATSAGAIARFPIIEGILALTIFADADEAGAIAAQSCARRWAEAAREARIIRPGSSYLG
jgi:hypothetical protein